ncbi:unnamed protein product [Haemonchus placei]|uniref:Serpentine receptor class gamma n=1 Tax=Haemonchus placei TaxID=6290 RepID=A0A158QQ07_HAEPC|nr:unnamed protein product [Haemonchus placei]
MVALQWSTMFGEYRMESEMGWKTLYWSNQYHLQQGPRYTTLVGCHPTKGCGVPMTKCVVSLSKDFIPAAQKPSFQLSHLKGGTLNQIVREREYIILMGDETSARTNGVIFAFEKFCFAFWIITVPFYILLMYALVRAQRKKSPSLTSSFYKLCITAGFIDIVNLLNNYFGAVFPKWGWFTSVYLFLGKPYVYTYLVIAWGSGINQAISVSMLAANRLSAILVPQYYHKIWAKQRLNLAMVIQIVPGYIIPALLFLRNKVHIKETHTGGLVPAFQGKNTTESYFTIAGLFLAANCLFLVLAYCYLFFMLRIRHHAQLEMVKLGTMTFNSSHFITGIVTISERICFVYWLFTVPFYTFIVWVLIRAQRKKIPNLTSSFYKICIVTGFIDIVTLLTSYFGSVFPMWGWFTSVYIRLGKAYAYTYLIFAWASGINQAVSVSVVAANRLSAILFPHRYAEFWHGRRLQAVVAIQTIPGFMISLMILGNEVILERTKRGGVIPQLVDNLYSGVSAYLLWIFSEDLRRYVYELLGIKKQSGNITVTIVTCRQSK